MLYNAMKTIDIDAEVTLFLCSIVAFVVLSSFRKKHYAHQGKPRVKHIETTEEDVQPMKCSAQNRTSTNVKADKALRAAFEEEDYWQVLQCWEELKRSPQSFIHLSVVIRSMRSCNKGAFYIVNSLRSYFRSHPQTCKIGLFNDLLEPLSRSHEDAFLVDFLIKMLPAVKLNKDSRTYEILLTMYSASSDHVKAQEVIAEMKGNDIAFTPCATVAVLTMGLQMGNVEVVLKAFAKLKPSWDIRSTWTVSMFALERHKTSLLVRIATLACQSGKVWELSEAFSGMTIPQDVADAVHSKLALLSEADLTMAKQVIEKSGRSCRSADPVYNALLETFGSRSKPRSRADSNASTSEGTRSDSEEESNFRHSCSPPPGLRPPPGFH